WGYDENENGIADVFEKTYTVSYDANDGTGAPADETLILTGTHHTLSAAVPTHADVNDTAVVFIGWSTAQDAHIYGANDDIPNVITSMTVTENTTLYAVWGYDENTNGTADVIEGAHTFTYSWENITSDNETEYVIANGSYTATLTPNAGYAIASVTVTMDGVDITSEAYNAETGKITIASVTGEVKITAEAELIRYSVAYDANGGKGEMTDENSPYGYGETATVLENTFTRSSYKFDGWNTAADGSGISYSAGDELTVNADVTLCAQWKRTGSGGGGGGSTTITQYTVTFNTNGGSTIGSVKVDKNDTLSEPEEPTKSGYEFAGWYTSAELTSEYDFDAKVTENFTLYAKWTAEESGKGAADDEHDCPSKKFTDVDTNLWYHEYIDYALENGIMNGTSTTTFEPDTAITRGMIVTMLYRLEDEPEADAAYGFDDVAEGMYYTDAIAWSAENEIIYGYGDGNFGPDDAITREQMAAIMYRYAQYKGYDVSVGEDTNILSFDDALEISEYAIAAMQWACGCGLIEGTGTALEPAGTATRAQAAAIFTRACEMMKKAE
ncbi:MAG: InlB B-repeat-containing protein, partial [Clostridia bacterium]|nr:InlB B-repeat-containing protein [Clostridia bacterium]